MNIPIVNYKPNTMMDNLIALRLLCLLTTPFNETEAFKAGLINEKGEYIIPKGKRSKDQEKSVNYLIKLVFNVKKLLNKLPGGENKMKNLLAAMWMIKEETEHPGSQILSENMLASISDKVDIRAEKWAPMIDMWKRAAELRESGIVAMSIDALGNPSDPKIMDQNGISPVANGIGNMATIETKLSSPVSQMWMHQKKVKKGEPIVMGDEISARG